MADNVAITAGSGTSIATDDISSVHYQRVKNVWGADGTATDVSAATPMPVVAGQSQLWVEGTFPGTSTTAYVANDQVGTLLTISNAARNSGGGGWINGIMWYDDDDVMGALDFFFYKDSVTLASDSAAFSLSDADAQKIRYVASMTYLTDLGAQRFGQLTGLSVPYNCTGTSLYVSVRSQASATLVSATSQKYAIALTLD